MKTVLRWLATATMSSALAFTVTTAPGCGDGGTGTPDATSGPKCEGKEPGTCECAKNTDCGANRFEWICTPAKVCVKICDSNSDCATGFTCDDAICRPPACGNDAQCGSAEQCIGGACKPKVTAASVATCTVLPTAALLREGKTEKFSVVARDSAGAVLAFKDAVTWSSSADASATVSAEGVATGGATTGAVQIRAKIGALDCAAGNARNYQAVAAGKFRAVVADLNTHLPLKGATVQLGEETKVTGDDGVAEFDVTGNSKRSVHAFHATYAYVSAIEVQGTDVILYTKAAQTPAKFTGNMDAKAFYSLSDLKGTVRLALHGSSIAGNLIDIEVATLLGNMVETELDLGSQKTTVPLPEGTVIGLGEQMFRGDTGKPFTIVSPPGVRTIWGLGGNAEFSAITQALAPALSGGEDINIGDIMTKLLPLLGRLQSGALTGEVAVAGETKDLNTQEGTKKNDAGQDVPRMVSKLKLNTLMRIRAEAVLPNLPTYKFNGTDTKFEGAIVLGGALHGPQGLVPLGITAGIDEDGNGQVDANETGGTAGKLAVRFAPLHSGMESSRYAALALAASFGGLIGGGDEGGESPPTVLSGLVALPETLSYNADAPTPITFPGSFLSVPDAPAVTGRTVSLGGAVPGAAFHRLSIGGVETGEWLVYFPAGGSSFDLPTPPAAFADRLMTLDGDDLPGVLVQSMRLGSTGLTYEDVMAFDGKDTDDLSVEIDAFSLREIKRPAAL